MAKSIYAVKQVVAIGASAGGLEPLQSILKELPDSLRNTTIIIAQHTSPNYESMLVSLLKKTTRLNVMEAKHGLAIEPNFIYTCPADTDVQLIGGKFKFSKPSLIGPKPSVDKLFHSLAKAYKSSVIGVIISGTGHDGTQGISEIKKYGGFTIAQDPETANYSGMPDSAILSDLVDLVLSPDQIGQEIPKLLNDDYRSTILNENELNSASQDEVQSVRRILNLLHQKTGTDFSGYKTSTIHRRLEKRIHDKRYTSLEDYALEVKDNPEELDQLFLYLLIGVTQFFRNPDSIENLTEVLKQSLSEHPSDLNFRVWVPGCATGEEAYTIAMVIDDLIKNGSPKPQQVQIFATDIDKTPLNKARIGKYTANSVKNMPEYFKNTYFTKHNDEYIVSQEIKKYILFSKHDLTSNPPFLRLNMVSCRNLLIYFKSALQNQILPLFHYTLEPNGILFLGKSETVGRFKNLYETVDLKHKIYRRRQTDSSVSHIPLLQPMARSGKTKTSKNLLNQVMTVTDMVKETFYNGYEHPYIVVDDGLNIVEINKDVSFYLTLQHGTPNFNAIKLIHKDLRLDLRTLVGMAHNSLAMVKGNYRKLERENEVRYTRLKVQPTLYSKPKSPYFIVSFENADQNDHTHRDSMESDSAKDAGPIIAELEDELATTKEHLNTLVEELETSNEELQSLNEELQSSNEELQASNEELETSNEELQATNEELNVAYNELRSATHKIEEQSVVLKKSQNNFKSLLDNTQQAFILINRDYNVLLFNNYAFGLYKELFNVRLTEGVIYIDILPSEYLQKFHKRFQEALKGKQTSFEQEVIDNKGQQRYLAFNYTPVESDNNKFIENVSLSFIDITDKKRYEIALKQAYDQAEDQSKLWKKVFDDSPELIAIFSGEDFKISYANKSFKNLFPKRELSGRQLAKVLPEVEEQGFLDLMLKVRTTGKGITRKEVAAVIDYKGNGEVETRYFNFTYRSIIEKDQPFKSIISHAVDVTNQVEKRFKVEEEEQFLRLISETLPQHVWVLLPQREIEFMNDSGLKFYGLEAVKKLGFIEESVHPEEKNDFRKRMALALSEGKRVRGEYRFKNWDGEYCWHMLHALPMRDDQDVFSKLVVSCTDINEQKISQKNKDDFMGVASHELKTPLTSVKAYTQLLQEHLENSGDDLASNYLEKTNNSVRKLEKFVSDLLDISRIQRGKLTLEKTQMSITALIKNVVDNLQVTSKSHKINTEIGRQNVFVHADQARVEQVLVNLINNAIKYSPESKEVIISLKKKMDYVEISVQDFGIGIPETDLDNVFDRFYRVSEHQNKISGLGIGLNISKEIVHLHHGKVWVESKLKEGSIFYFTLPLNHTTDEENTAM
ncbi:PAS domain S-box protein [Fulvivirga sp. M361]|uniref:chemotaxis protein CheB n=1 Tax=Fulvivirga sp. M361 TaxID=2594266 RepID=UPI00117B26CB|nr:chemotaxis protein CheB [Fulvivirga sp. M361]TRX60509.1 PAS domain S-box protein [Fulvivirga sp. M361]